eukprot:821369-Pyramimonas_sp.AAC.1
MLAQVWTVFPSRVLRDRLKDVSGKIRTIGAPNSISIFVISYEDTITRGRHGNGQSLLKLTPCWRWLTRGASAPTG